MKVLKNAKLKSRVVSKTTVAVAKYNGDTWFAVPTKDGLYHVSTQVWGFRGYYIRERLKGIFGEM